MEDPLVSVKMITYNHALFIAQAIDCVLQQKTNFPFELVIGEDCSTDGTRDIVFEYQKKYPEIIRVITSDENVGMKKNGYRTTKACRGKYVAFCEGDDYWHHPEKLQKQVDYMENHPKCGLVYSSYDVYKVKNKKIIKDYIKHNKWTRHANPNIIDLFCKNGELKSPILTCTVMVRRNLMEKIIESDPFLHQSEFLRGDTQLWVEIMTMSNVHYIPESLSTYRFMEESATASKDVKKLLQLQLADKDLLLYLCNKYNLPLNIKKEIELRKLHVLLKMAFFTRDASLADEVRRKKTILTYKEWLLYLGTKHEVIYRPLKIAILNWDSLKIFFSEKRGKIATDTMD